jgi:hypothetical protein
MQSTEQLQESIGTERMRMSQVRKAFGAGLQHPPQAPSALGFYTACCEYLQAALERLHAQDQRIIEILSPLVPTEATEDRKILGQFQAGLDAIRVALDRLMDSLATYQKSNGQGQCSFEAEAHKFLDVFINVLAARRHTSSHLEEQHFDRDDWASVAFASDVAKQREIDRFNAVKQFAPAEADPDLFRAGPPPTN